MSHIATSESVAVGTGGRLTLPDVDGWAAETDPVPVAAPAVPSVPGFTTLTKLGEGGMGVVYHAHDSHGREAALKLAPAGPPDSPQAVRFQTEAEAVAAVTHPHVVHVYEWREHAGRPYLAMEYLPGGSLAERLKAAGGKIAPRDAAALVETVARAVHAIHEAGYIHRDLKPANILFDAAGSPRVVDFGIAKRYWADPTTTGEVVGTPAYMAPEQAAGKPDAVAPQADVWSLGAILYEALAGVRPFGTGSVHAVLHRVLHDDPPPVRRATPGVPRDLERVCLRCLEKAPRDRYPSAAALADDLARFARGEGVAVRPFGKADRGRMVAVGLAAVAVALLAFGAWATVEWRRADAARADAVDANRGLVDEKAKADEALHESERERTRLAANLDDARAARDEAEAARKAEADLRARVEAKYEPLVRLHSTRLVGRAFREWQGNDPARARDTLHDCPARFRGWEWDYVSRLTRNGPAADRVIPTRPAAVLAVSPAADRLLVERPDSRVAVWGVDGGFDAPPLRVGPAVLRAAAFSPDGKRVATGDVHGAVIVWVTTTGAEVTSAKPAGAMVTALAWAEDGNRLAVGRADGSVVVWDARTGASQRTLTGHGGAIAAVAFRRDGTRLTTAGTDGSLRAWDAATGTAVWAVTGRVGFRSVAVSPDGTALASGDANGAVRLWDAATGAERLAVDGGRPVGPVVAYHPSGDRLATGDLGGQVRLWDTSDGAEVFARDVVAGAKVNVLQFTADGTKLAAGNRASKVTLWDGTPTTPPLAGR